jgi:hypothetical protein
MWKQAVVLYVQVKPYCFSNCQEELVLTTTASLTQDNTAPKHLQYDSGATGRILFPLKDLSFCVEKYV